MSDNRRELMTPDELRQIADLQQKCAKLQRGGLVMRTTGPAIVVGANVDCASCGGRGFAFVRAKLGPRRLVFTYQRCACAPKTNRMAVPPDAGARRDG
jgi:hypothetical protein